MKVPEKLEFDVRFIDGHIEQADKRLIRDYWAINNGSREFVYTVSELEDKYNISQSSLYKTVREYSRVDYLPRILCRVCCIPIYRSPINRTELCALETGDGRSWICNKCYQAAEQKKSKEERTQVIEYCKKAYEEKRYETLGNIEFNFLVDMAFGYKSSGSCIAPTDPSKHLGISIERGWEIYKAIKSQKLIYIINDGWGIPEPYCTMLVEQGRKAYTKSIFGSPKAEELYRELRKEHLFVFPEIPLAAFIDMSKIEHKFSEGWQREYFLKCRVDFLICDHHGNPTSAAEYDGGYHKDDELQEKKDRFKNDIMAEAGVGLRRYDYGALLELKKENNGDSGVEF